jgi:hypothetical protein
MGVDTKTSTQMGVDTKTSTQMGVDTKTSTQMGVDVLASSPLGKTTYQILEDVGAISATIPAATSFIDFYDIMGRLQKDFEATETTAPATETLVSREEWKRLAQRFGDNFDSVWKSEQNQLTDFMKIVENPPIIIPLPNIANKLFEQPIQGSAVYFDQYSEYIGNIGRYLDTRQSLNLLLRALKYVADTFTEKKLELMEVYDNIMEHLNRQKTYLHNLKLSIGIAYSYFYPSDPNEVKALADIKTGVAANPTTEKFLRYWSDWKTLQNIVSSTIGDI